MYRRDIKRRVVLLGIPLLLGVLELGHPLLDHVNPIKMLAPIVVWWIILHVLLIPLLALMGWAFFLLLQGVESRAATLCRYAAVVYIAFAIGYDAAVGLDSGILASNALAVSNAQQLVIQDALHHLYANPAITLSYYVYLSAGIVAVCAAIWALVRIGAPVLPACVLLGTLSSVYSHAAPFGPFGSACFFVAALWIEIVWRKSFQKESNAIAITSASQ